MPEKLDLKKFEDALIRTAWDAEKEEWYFSVVDVCSVLTDSVDARKYWNKLKQRLKAEGNETVTNCHQLKMKAPDGKMRLTDVADTEQLLRLVQSIPSPRAEPFKIWLAQVGSERLDEEQDPELTIERALQTYLRMGYSEEWINQRLKTIEVRRDLTDEWRRRGIQPGQQFATLTDIISKAWPGKTTRQYKSFKGLAKQNLRDNMTNAELVLNMLAELSATRISQIEEPDNFEKSAEVARRGGGVARAAREQLEKETGEAVVTPQNAQQLRGGEVLQLEDATQDQKE